MFHASGGFEKQVCKGGIILVIVKHITKRTTKALRTPLKK
jgi:hypothetical protein